MGRLSAIRRVFIVMGFNDEALNSAYEKVMKKVIVDFGYQPVRIDQMRFAGGVSDQILAEIEQSEIVLAELSGERPNCYYEAGYAHALHKEIILTNYKASPIAFNLRNHPFIEWKSEPELEGKLRERFKELVKDTQNS